MGDSPCPPHIAEPGFRVSVDVKCVPVVSEALARAGVPVVAVLTLSGTGAAVHGARLTVGIETAEGPLGSPVELVADVVPDRTTVLTDVGLRLDPAVLAAVAEPTRAVVAVRIERDGQLLGTRSVPVRVLAAGQWLAAPAPLALELLAAHVLPDSPAVAGLV